MRKNKNEEGAAILVVIILTSALFMLLAVAIRGFVINDKLNRIILKDCASRAEKIVLTTKANVH